MSKIFELQLEAEKKATTNRKIFSFFIKEIVFKGIDAMHLSLCKDKKN